jgi:hypothetical protein
MSWLSSIKDKYFTREQKKKPAKRRSPREIIENEQNPDVEHGYIKFPGKEIINVTLYSDSNNLYMDERKMKELGEEFKLPHTEIHTHLTYGSGVASFPTPEDFTNFLGDQNAKTMIVVQKSNDPKNKNYRKVEGYYAFRKRKEADKYPTLEKINNLYLTIDPNLDPTNSFLKNEEMGLFELNREKMDMFAKHLGLQWKFVPANYYKVKLVRKDSPLHVRFAKEEQPLSLETKLAVSISILVLSSALLFSSNFTGFTIASLDTKSLNILGGSLFIVGLISLFFNLKKSEQKKRK